ncbi:MAG: type III pantothenate kinase [Pyrinomonadaceae bacterium]
MLLAVDIGNTNIKFGFYDGPLLTAKSSFSTHSESFEKRVTGVLVDKSFTRVIICSAVPSVEARLAEMIKREYSIHAVVVRNDFDFGLKISYEPLSAIGTDRLVNCFSAVAKYGAPCIVCSFGTAATFDLVDENRELVGGAIAPGLAAMAKALSLVTARLPEVAVDATPALIATTTEGSIHSGVFFGHMGAAEGIVERFQAEFGQTVRVVATGGHAQLVAENTKKTLDTVDENLLLDGLRILSERYL